MTLSPEAPAESNPIIEDLKSDLSQAHELLDEAIADANMTHVELEAERAMRHEAEKRLAKALALVDALTEDLSKQADPNQTAQLRAELERARATLNSVERTFKDVLRFTMPFVAEEDPTNLPLGPTFSLIEETLESSSQLLAPVVVVDKTAL